MLYRQFLLCLRLMLISLDTAGEHPCTRPGTPHGSERSVGTLNFYPVIWNATLMHSRPWILGRCLTSPTMARNGMDCLPVLE